MRGGPAPLRPPYAPGRPTWSTSPRSGPAVERVLLGLCRLGRAGARAPRPAVRLLGVPGGGQAVSVRPGRAEAPGWRAAAATVSSRWRRCCSGDHRYFWYGDTPAAYYGWWYHLGDLVRHGQWSTHRPARLAGRQPRGRGPVGPVVAADRSAIGLVATVVPHAAGRSPRRSRWRWRSVGALGVFRLVRSYDAPPAAAYVAAVAVPMGGMTQYLDLPSWVAGRDDLGAVPVGVVGGAPHHGARRQPAAGAGARLPAGHRRLRLRHDHAGRRPGGLPARLPARPRPRGASCGCSSSGCCSVWSR